MSLLNRAIDAATFRPAGTFFGRVARVTCWRETIPVIPTAFHVQRLPNSTEITDLRIQFKVKRALTKSPDQADVTITNLAPSTRVDLETKPLLVQVEAGYEQDVGPRLLFAGDLRFGMTKLDGPTWETLLQIGDGDCHHRWSRVNKHYAPNTTIRKILTDTAGSLGLGLPPALASDPALDAKYEHGTIAFGPAREELTRLLASYGYHWCLQDGKLIVLRDDQVSSNNALLIDEERGMIGTPEYGSPPRSGKPPHMHVKMLLYPEIMPGALVKLTSKVKNGFFRVENVEHAGDTWGTGDASWTTNIEIKPF